MVQRLMIRLLLGLSLLEGGRVSCQTAGDPSTKVASPSEIYPCEPGTQECKAQITAREMLNESVLCSLPFEEQIVIQKLKKVGKNAYVPDAVNFYRGEVTFGKEPQFRQQFRIVNWSRLFWQFNLRGFAEMCFIDPHHFDSWTYDLRYSGDEMMLGRRCWVYRVTPKKYAKGWHFDGKIWVFPRDLAIIRFQGAFYPMHKILWLFLVEDYWFSFDSWRKETRQGNWVPDYTCTGVGLAASDFTKPPLVRELLLLAGTEINRVQPPKMRAGWG